MPLFSSLVATGLLAGSAQALTQLSGYQKGLGQYPFAKPYDQSFLEGYSPLKHIGGFGPYSNRQSYGISRNPPEACYVDQVLMVKRHGERYPESSDVENMLDTIDKMRGQVSVFKGDLAFFNDWEFYTPDGYIGLETYSSAYNGLLESYINGADYRTRYGHLWDQSSDAIIPMWSSDNERVLQTARKFGEGFFGWNYTNVVAMNVISEDDSQGADSLTPDCPDANATVCDALDNNWPIYEDAVARLTKQNPGLNITVSDIANLLEMGVQELQVRGYSEWVNSVFTLDELLTYGYISSLSYYYCSGPGSPTNIAIGTLWANATLALLNQGPSEGTLYFSFTHDNDITPILAALGVSSPAEDLPIDHIAFPNNYNAADIIPMGGHLTVERLSCNATQTSPADTYVRLVLNEAVVPFTGCQEGPGWSCSLDNFTSLLSASLAEYNFIEDCGVNASYPQYLDFFWNYNTSTAWDVQTAEYIPYQGSPVV